MEFDWSFIKFLVSLLLILFNSLTGSVVHPSDLTGPWFSFRGLDKQKPFYCEVCDNFLRPERNLTHKNPPCIIYFCKDKTGANKKAKLA